MTAEPITLLKVGGSLLDWPKLPSRLSQFVADRRQREPGFRPVLFCGGGPFANAIRRLDRLHHLGDSISHRLAIQSMDLASTVLLCLLPEAVGIDCETALHQKRPTEDIPLLLPSLILDELEQSEPCPFPNSWDVTSDTLAAWVASRLGARSLILLKSAPLPLHATRDVAAQLNLVDPYFPTIASTVARVEYINLRDDSARSADLL